MASPSYIFGYVQVWKSPKGQAFADNEVFGKTSSKKAPFITASKEEYFQADSGYK